MKKKHNYSYITINKINGKCYVGSHSTDNMFDNYLGSGVYISKAIKKYGKENFKKIIIKTYKNIEECLSKEEYYINLFDTLIPNGYNIASKGWMGKPGQIFSEDTLIKIRKKRKLQIFSKETREKMSISRLGKSRTQETKEKIRKSSKGKKGWNKGIPRTEEAKQNISRGSMGRVSGMKGKTHSPETIEKMKINNALEKNGFFGKHHSEEFKQKMRKPKSEETKRKMSEAAKHRNRKMNEYR